MMAAARIAPFKAKVAMTHGFRFFVRLLDSNVESSNMADLESGVEFFSMYRHRRPEYCSRQGWQPNWGQQKCAQPISDTTVHLQNMMQKLCNFARFRALATRTSSRVIYSAWPRAEQLPCLYWRANPDRR